MVIVDIELSPEDLLSEIVSNLESVNATVKAGCVLIDGNQVAIYDSREQK